MVGRFMYMVKSGIRLTTPNYNSSDFCVRRLRTWTCRENLNILVKSPCRTNISMVSRNPKCMTFILESLFVLQLWYFFVKQWFLVSVSFDTRLTRHFNTFSIIFIFVIIQLVCFDLEDCKILKFKFNLCIFLQFATDLPPFSMKVCQMRNGHFMESLNHVDSYLRQCFSYVRSTHGTCALSIFRLQCVRECATRLCGRRVI